MTNLTKTKMEYSKKVREALGITQKELAKRTGVSLIAVSRWDQGRAKPNPSAMILILDMINLTKTKKQERYK